jgi:Protein of unknown function (DUF3108).
MTFCVQQDVLGQCGFENQPFKVGEKVGYALYFKWGILMPKAGQASIDFLRTNEENSFGYSHRLLFRTTGMFETVYKMRDTLASFHDNNMILIRSGKNSDEGGYYSIDKIRFSYEGDGVSAHSLRYTPTRVRIDTTLVAEGCTFDMMSSLLYLRSLDYANLKNGDRFSFKVMIGRDVVNVGFHYKGQEILERDNAKFKTLHFTMDIYDEIFEQSESAAEIWIGDDENRIPVRLRAKLKLGAAEAYYTSSSGLRYPLTCRIEMPKGRR